MKKLLEENGCLERLTKASIDLDSQTNNMELKRHLKSYVEKSKVQQDDLKARIDALIGKLGYLKLELILPPFKSKQYTDFFKIREL